MKLLFKFLNLLRRAFFCEFGFNRTLNGRSLNFLQFIFQQVIFFLQLDDLASRFILNLLGIVSTHRLQVVENFIFFIFYDRKGVLKIL